MLEDPTITTHTIAEQVSTASLPHLGTAMRAQEPDIRLLDVIAVK